jgi:hypothetical protein
MTCLMLFKYKVWHNRRFNADANTGHGFAIFMGFVGPLHSLRSFLRRLPWALDLPIGAY